MRYQFLTFFFLLFSVAAIAQKITISGKVIDNESKEPLPFATIGIKDKSIGTITNLQGEFDFHIPRELQNDLFVINMLGYQTYEAPVWTLVESSSLVIEVKKSTTVLDEVLIADSLSGGEILQIAISRIEQNYPMQPHLLDGFYRDVKKVGGTYVSLLEAAVKIYDEDYREPRNKYKLRERVGLLEVRRSIGYESAFTTYFDQENLLEVLLLHNSVRYRHFPTEQIFYDNMVRRKDSYYNGFEIFVVSQRNNDNLKVYIEKKTYAIVHLEFLDDQEEQIRKRRGLVSKAVSTYRVIDFKPFEGKYYLNYLTISSQVNWYDLKTDKLKFETELNQSLLINEVFPNTANRIPATEKMRNYGLQYQDLPYNKEFWDNYNVIKESPLDRKIIADLERHGSLEAQFKEN